MSAVQAAAAVKGSRQADSSNPFLAFERKVQALRKEWHDLAERHDIDEYTRRRADDGFGEARCAADEAWHQVEDRQE